MRKHLFYSLLGLLTIIALIFIFVELKKDETFTIVENEAETSVWIESNKLLNPNYKRALLVIENVQIVNTTGNEIDIDELKIGATIKADFKLALLSDPPILSASKILLLK